MIPKQPSAAVLAAFGAAGAIAPDIILLYSKRWSMPSLTFDPWQYVAATAMYVCLAALAAAVYPYGRKRTHWAAFAVGAGLPVIVSGLAAMSRDPLVTPRGELLSGTFVDLLALF